MKKNLFLIIITLITVLCIIIGASRHLGVPRKSYSSLASSLRKGFRSGRFHFNFNDDDEDEMEDFDFDDEDPKSFDSGFDIYVARNKETLSSLSERIFTVGT